MNTETLQAQFTVEDILKKWPQAYAVFNSRNTACVGCMLQRFCTLQDVAETYNISLPNLVVDLKNYVNGNTQTIRRTQ